MHPKTGRVNQPPPSNLSIERTRKPGLADDVHALDRLGRPHGRQDVEVLEHHVRARHGGAAFDVDDYG